MAGGLTSARTTGRCGHWRRLHGDRSSAPGHPLTGKGLRRRRCRAQGNASTLHRRLRCRRRGWRGRAVFNDDYGRRRRLRAHHVLVDAVADDGGRCGLGRRPGTAAQELCGLPHIPIRERGAGGCGAHNHIPVPLRSDCGARRRVLGCGQPCSGHDQQRGRRGTRRSSCGGSHRLGGVLWGALLSPVAMHRGRAVLPLPSLLHAVPAPRPRRHRLPPPR